MSIPPLSYDEQTINSPNPLARFSHRRRLAKSIALVAAHPGVQRLLDYGCGSGDFLRALQQSTPLQAIGYEPFMLERAHEQLPIHNNLEAIREIAPFDLITVFETIEHLTRDELMAFLVQAKDLLSPHGRILFSAPIEIGPALLLKTLNRASRAKRWPPELSLRELAAACLLGIPQTRAENIKISHQGFDFRQAITDLQHHFGPVEIASYGPLPTGTWYGNSQVFFWLQRSLDAPAQPAERHPNPLIRS